VDENKFNISMLDGSWDVEAHERPDKCYDVHATVFGWPVSDTACRTDQKEAL
jgi:hypothetical protein